MTKICVCKVCILVQKYFLLCVHMAFKINRICRKLKFYSIKVIVISLNSCLNALIWILQVSKLLLGESTYVTMHML